MKKLLYGIGGLLATALVALGLAIAFGGPGTPQPLRSISDPFRGVDFSDLPPLQTFLCRGGDALAFREYSPPGVAVGTVVLVHGSSAHSASMHRMSKAFAKAGYRAYALDMRGHGASGEHGQIRVVGHLDYDLEDFVRAARIGGKATLVGFSAGGGFALRFAASERQDFFASYVLLAPFISQDAPTYREGGGGWVSVGVPRIVALSILNSLGITQLNHLPVTRFAVAEQNRASLTPEYSFALATNFRPRSDYMGSIRAARRPMAIVAGDKDELFHTDRYEALFRSAGNPVPVTIVPGVGHVGLILEERALEAAVAAVRRLEPPPIGSAGSRG